MRKAHLPAICDEVHAARRIFLCSERSTGWHGDVAGQPAGDGLRRQRLGGGEQQRLGDAAGLREGPHAGRLVRRASRADGLERLQGLVGASSSTANRICRMSSIHGLPRSACLVDGLHACARLHPDRREGAFLLHLEHALAHHFERRREGRGPHGAPSCPARSRSASDTRPAPSSPPPRRRGAPAPDAHPRATRNAARGRCTREWACFCRSRA